MKHIIHQRNNYQHSEAVTHWLLRSSLARDEVSATTKTAMPNSAAPKTAQYKSQLRNASWAVIGFTLSARRIAGLRHHPPIAPNSVSCRALGTALSSGHYSAERISSGNARLHPVHFASRHPIDEIPAPVLVRKRKQNLLPKNSPAGISRKLRRIRQCESLPSWPAFSF